MSRWLGYRIHHCRRQISNLEQQRNIFLEMYSRALAKYEELHDEAINDEVNNYDLVLDSLNEKIVKLHRELARLQSRNG